MNGLSWLLYIAEVSDNAKGVIVGVYAAAAVVACFAPVGFMMADKDPEDLPPAYAKAAKALFVPFLVSLSMLVLIPSKNTLMLIAASEVGETVLASKDVQAIGGEAGALATDSLKLLRKYVTEQLGEEKAK